MTYLFTFIAILLAIQLAVLILSSPQIRLRLIASSLKLSTKEIVLKEKNKGVNSSNYGDIITYLNHYISLHKLRLHFYNPFHSLNDKVSQNAESKADLAREGVKGNDEIVVSYKFEELEEGTKLNLYIFVSGRSILPIDKGNWAIIFPWRKLSNRVNNRLAALTAQHILLSLAELQKMGYL